jgi:hypothetical protein
MSVPYHRTIKTNHHDTNFTINSSSQGTIQLPQLGLSPHLPMAGATQVDLAQWLPKQPLTPLYRGFRAAERQNAPCVSVVQQPSYVPVRHLSSSCPLQKRAGKANTAHAKSDSSPPINKAFVPTPTDEAFDYSAIEAKILDAVEKLTHELKQLRAGGRFNPDLLEGLRVSMGKSGAKETFRLGDLAQVVPKGRLINVIVGDKDVGSPGLTEEHLCYRRGLTRPTVHQAGQVGDYGLPVQPDPAGTFAR